MKRRSTLAYLCIHVTYNKVQMLKSLRTINTSVPEDLNTQIVERAMNSNMGLPNFHSHSRYLREFCQSGGCYEFSHRLQKIIRRSFHDFLNYAVVLLVQTIRRTLDGNKINNNSTTMISSKTHLLLFRNYKI